MCWVQENKQKELQENKKPVTEEKTLHIATGNKCDIQIVENLLY